MKALKILVVLALIGGGGYFAYTHFLRPPEKAICARLSKVCGGDKMGAHEMASCEAAVKKLKEVAGDKAVHKAEACIAEVDTCSKAAGCVFGASLSTLGDFLDGVKSALKK
ncbi:MAG: hypothetical protein KAI47_00225 [Deltaproteobacteria bacterium]|nr:hypothetical protein [Deltaproteobacteria bacterium]